MGACYEAQEIQQVLCDDLEGWDVGEGCGKEAQEGLYIYIYLSVSLLCTTERNTIL